MDATVEMFEKQVSPDASENSTTGRLKKKSTVKRVQLDLPLKSVERLNHLRDKVEAASYAEVIRNALRLYEDMVNKSSSGREFLVRDKSGNIAPYEVFLTA